MKRYIQFAFLSLLVTQNIFSQRADPFKPDFNPPIQVAGMSLMWNDEFNTNGKPDPRNWKYETGFVRNQELQWYQSANANCVNGVLLIEGRKERLPNPNYKDSSNNWKFSRRYAEYTSSSIKTEGLQQFMFGRLEVRARINTSTGSW